MLLKYFEDAHIHTHIFLYNSHFRHLTSLNHCRQLLKDDAGEAAVQRPAARMSSVSPQTVLAALKKALINLRKVMQTVMEGKAINIAACQAE